MLESRSLPSNLVPTLAAPLQGSVVTSSPAQIVVTFNEPIDPTTLSNFNWSTGLNDPTIPESDFILLESAAPGGPFQQVNTMLTEAVSPTDPTTLVISASAPLPVGSYQVALSGQSFIASVTGDIDPNAFGSQNDVFGGFTIAPPPPQVTLAGATALPAPNSTVQSLSGSLQFGPGQSGVDLYRFSLGPATVWQFGAQALTSSVGSTLEPTLALFNASGALISETNLGPSGDPTEPYMFTGLAPGTYYLGVSDTANVPGAPGGYNPATGFAGSNPPVSTQGGFSLQFTATQNPPATQVIDFQVDRADPMSSVPTGLTIQFSGPLSIGSSNQDPMEVLNGAIRVVSSSGVTIPVTVTSFNELTSTVTYIFNSPPPSGLYTVELVPGSGLSDLAARLPINPNFGPGVLGQFFLPTTPPNTSALNLGALYPSQITNSSVTTSSTLPAHASASETYRFVVIEPGLYSLSAESSAPVILLLEGSGGALASLGVNPGPTAAGVSIHLSPGTYLLVVNHAATITRVPVQSTPGTSVVTVDWSLTLLSGDAESAISLGVGPGAALGLRLISPMPPVESSSSSSASPDPISSPTPVPISSQAGTIASPGQGGDGSGSGALVFNNVQTGLTPTALPPGIALTFTSNVVGRPAAGNDMVPTVGPPGAGNAVALALNGLVPSGVNRTAGEDLESEAEGLGSIVSDARGGSDPLVVAARTGEDAAESTASASVQPSLKPNLGESADTNLALDWDGLVGKLSEFLAGLTSGGRPAPAGSEANDQLADTSEAGAGVLSSDGDPKRQLERSSLTTPLGVGVLAMLLYQSRGRISGWLGKGRSAANAARSARLAQGVKGSPAQPKTRF